MIDTTHDMYLPDKRAPKRTSRRKLEPGMIGADQFGTQSQKEAWMRQKQSLKATTAGRPKKDRHHENSAINQLIRREQERALLNAPDESGIWAI